MICIRLYLENLMIKNKRGFMKVPLFIKILFNYLSFNKTKSSPSNSFTLTDTY